MKWIGFILLPVSVYLLSGWFGWVVLAIAAIMIICGD